MYLVTGVGGRSGIRIHPGSFAGASDKGFKTNFLGCISLGKGLLWDKKLDQYLLHTTAVTIRAIEEMLDCKDFELTIKGEFSPLLTTEEYHHD
jgi:hypothetical protein